MQEKKDKKIYVTIPNKGEHELQYLLDTLDYLRQLTWTYKRWAPSPALVDKSGGSSRQYVGQNFDPKYFDVIEDGWTHDHCEICFTTISDKDGYGDTDGYKTNNNEWVCKDCYNLFINTDNIQDIIKSLNTTEK